MAFPKTDGQFYSVPEINEIINGLEHIDTDVDEKIGLINQKIGDLNELETEAKTSLTEAVNEVYDDVSALNEDFTHLEKVIPIVDTASGAIASFSDGADSYPLKTLTCEINPVQDLHGYDNPWPAGGGKNLIGIEDRTETIRGITITQSADGTIVLNGTVTGGGDNIINVKPVEHNSYTPLTDIFPIEADVQYKLYGCPSGGSISTYRLQFLAYGSGQEPVDTGSGSSAFSFTQSQIESVRYRVAIRLSEGLTCNNLTFKPMIILASETDTSFAPYSNICPISGHIEVNAHVSPTTDSDDGTTVTYQLGQTVYGGTLTINDDGRGQIVSTMAMVDLGNISYTTLSIQGTPRICTVSLPNIKTPADDFYNPDGFCSVYKLVKTSELDMKDGSASIGTSIYSYGDRLILNDSRITNASQAQTVLNGQQFVYILLTPVTINLTAQEVIETLKGQNNIWHDANGDTTAEYRADTKLYIDGVETKITNLEMQIAPIEDGTTASQSYTAGKYFWLNNQFCKAKTNIASGATFTLNTNYEVTTVANELYTALQ